MTISDEERARRALVAALDRIDAREAARTDKLQPLAPGETVTIEDFDNSVFRVDVRVREDGLFRLAFMIGGEEDDDRALDAAGVRALVEAGRRWLAGLGGDDDGEQGAT